MYYLSRGKHRVLLTISLVLLSFLIMLGGCGTGPITVEPTAGTPEPTVEATVSASTEATVSATTEVTASATVETTPKATLKYDPPIEITFIRSTGEDEEKRITALKGITGEDYESNRWLKLYEAELGIKVKYSWIAKGDQYTQKFKLAIASGDIPDIFDAGQIDLKQLAESDMITDLKPYYKELADPITVSTLEADGSAPFDAATIDGKLYGIPEVMPNLDSYSYLWVRSDWQQKLGLEKPKTMADLLGIMSAFTHKDPDGNGKDDTLGLLLDKSLWYRLDGFFYCYHAYPNRWIEDASGKLVYGAVQPEMKAALKSLQNLFNDGQIDKEFGVKDDAKASELVASGKIGVMFGGHWESAVSPKALHDIDPNSDWKSYPLPSIDEKPAIGSLALNTTSWTVVNKNFKNPEAIVKMYNLYLEKLYGATGDYEHWGNDEIDGIWGMGPIHAHHPWINLNAHREILVAEQNGTTDQLKGVAKEYYGNITQFWEWKKMFDKVDSPFTIIDDVVKNNQYFVNKFVGTPTNTMIDKWATLEELKNSTVTKIILGELDADSGFDKFVSDWTSLGGEQIVKEVNEWYAGTKK